MLPRFLSFGDPAEPAGVLGDHLGLLGLGGNLVKLGQLVEEVDEQVGLVHFEEVHLQHRHDAGRGSYDRRGEQGDLNLIARVDEDLEVGADHLEILRELVGEGAFPRHLAFAVEVDHQGRRVLVAGRQHAQVSDIAVVAAPDFLGDSRGGGYAREGEVGQQEGGQQEGTVLCLDCYLAAAEIDYAPLERGVDEQFLPLEDGEVGESLLDGLQVKYVPLPEH